MPGVLLGSFVRKIARWDAFSDNAPFLESHFAKAILSPFPKREGESTKNIENAMKKHCTHKKHMYMIYDMYKQAQTSRRNPLGTHKKSIGNPWDTHRKPTGNSRETH